MNQDLTTCPYCGNAALVESGRILNHLTKDDKPCCLGNPPPDLIPDPVKGPAMIEAEPPKPGDPDPNIVAKLEMLLVQARSGGITDFFYIAVDMQHGSVEANYTGSSLVYVIGEMEILRTRLSAQVNMLRGLMG